MAASPSGGRSLFHAAAHSEGLADGFVDGEGLDGGALVAEGVIGELFDERSVATAA